MRSNKKLNVKFVWGVVAMLTVLALLIVGPLGCAKSKTAKGAAIGGAAGAAVGAVIGSQSDNTGKGAIIGGAAGAAIGGIIGHYMDKQAEELAKIEGAKTERIGDEIRVTWDSAILFDFDSSMLKVESQQNIRKMGEVFANYPDTDIVIAGHTDNVGSESYNQKLSERRAKAVYGYLVDIGIDAARLTTVGYGELRPISTNDTDAGRSANRRVEINIRANEELLKRAQEAESQG